MDTTKSLYGTSDRLIDSGATAFRDPKFTELQSKNLIKHLPDITKQMKMETEAEWKKQTDIIAALLIEGPFDATPFRIGIEAVYSAAMTGTWTAFETLAGDLWVKTINNYPRKLATLSGTPDRIKLLSEKGITKKGQKDKQNKIIVQEGENPVDDDNDDIDEDDDDESFRSKQKISLSDLDVISKGSYNLEHLMGDLLVKSGRVSFSSLDGIREGYSRAFSENIKGNTADFMTL